MCKDNKWAIFSVIKNNSKYYLVLLYTNKIKNNIILLVYYNLTIKYLHSFIKNAW